MSTTKTPKMTKTWAGAYTFNAVGRTYTVRKEDEAGQGVATWTVLDDSDRQVAHGTSRKDAVASLLYRLSR